MCRTLLSIRVATIVLCFAAASASVASARTYLYRDQITIPPGLPAPNDLHVYYSLYYPGPDTFSVAVQSVDPFPDFAHPNPAGTGIDIYWTPKLQAGNPLWVTIWMTCTKDTRVDSVVWTNDNAVIRREPGSSDVHRWFGSAPAASSTGMLVLALLVAGAGAAVLLRRRRTA